MAEGDLSWAAGSERREYLIRALFDRDEIRDRLWPQLEYAAYALGQLEPGLFERAHWFLAQGASGQGLVTHSRGGLGDASFVMGDPLAIAAVLSIEPGPTQSYITCQPQHLDALQRVYQLANRQPMMRMSVRAERFRPRTGIPAVRLHGVDIRRVNALYGSDGSPTYYSSEHVDGGVYRGVVVGGRLVAIAGTHVVSPQEHVAVVGNVFTHPSYRGYGYATSRDERDDAGPARTVRDRCAHRRPYEHPGRRRVRTAGLPRIGAARRSQRDAARPRRPRRLPPTHPREGPRPQSWRRARFGSGMSACPLGDAPASVFRRSRVDCPKQGGETVGNER